MVMIHPIHNSLRLAFVVGVLLCQWRGDAYIMRLSPRVIRKESYMPYSIQGRLLRHDSITKQQVRVNDRRIMRMKLQKEDLDRDSFVSSSLHTRRDTLRRVALQTFLFGIIICTQPTPVQAGPITEESNTFFANTAADANMSPSLYLMTNSTETTTSSSLIPQNDDEISISFPYESIVSSQKEGGGGLGIELADIEFRTNRRVYIKSIRPNSIASKLGIKQDWILVSINDQTLERTNAQGAAILISKTIRSILDGTTAQPSLDITFRDPYLFQKRLNNLSSSPTVTTQVAPAGDTTPRNIDGSVKFGNLESSQINQRVTVTQLIPPKLCIRKAQVDDLLEISYLGTVLDTGEVFDGSAIKINGQGIPGRGNDVSLFFVLGKQPFGQFPIGWDVGLIGMCVGERRRLILPPGVCVCVCVFSFWIDLVHVKNSNN